MFSMTRKLKRLKLIYLRNYLTKMKEKIKSFDNAIIPKKNDQIMVEKVYF